MFRDSIKISRFDQSRDILSMFCDLREFTRITAQKNLAPEAASKVASYFYNHVVEYCSLKYKGSSSVYFKPAGDGLLVVWELPEPAQQIRNYVNLLIAQIIQMHDNFSISSSLVPVEIPSFMGVGVMRGFATCVCIREGRADLALEDYFGYTINLASKLQNLARPAGIIMDKKSLEGAINKDLLRKFACDTRFIQDQGHIEVYVYGAAKGPEVLQPEIPEKGVEPFLIRSWEISDIFNYSHGYVLSVPVQSLIKAGLHPSNNSLIRDPYKVDNIIKIIANPKNQQLHIREKIENNRTLRQIIPYPILRCKAKLFIHTRGPMGKERRLELEKSVGIAGHVRDFDLMFCQDNFYSTIPVKKEEVLFDKVAIKSGTYKWHRKGIIWDESTMTNMVHIGIVYIYDLDHESDLKVLDLNVIAEPTWQSIENISPEGFDSWSQICIKSNIMKEKT